jgi:uncharacterized membrane protein YhaH (DUF805 family)
MREHDIIALGGLMGYGRINRFTYWTAIGLIAAVYAAIMLIAKKQVAVTEVALIAVAVPRLHDIGKSAWWAGAAFIAEIAVAVIGVVTLGEDARVLLGLFVLVIVGCMVWLGCKRGDPATNQFGEPPTLGVSWSFGRVKSASRKAQNETEHS